MRISDWSSDVCSSDLVRFNFVAHLNNVPWSQVQETARLIAPFGWHICIHSDQQSLPGLLPLLMQLETPFVLDHMGRVSAGNGVDSALFRQLLALREHDRDRKSTRLNSSH